MYNGCANEGMRYIKLICGEFLIQNGIKGNYLVFEVRKKMQFQILKISISLFQQEGQEILYQKDMIGKQSSATF
jgi:hypothetical protein